jgi:hypothetical protein
LADFYFTSLEFVTGKAIIDVQYMFVNLKASLGPGEGKGGGGASLGTSENNQVRLAH